MTVELVRRHIAGHVFDFNGRCTVGDCQRKLCDIMSATKENVGHEGWAHTGKLNQVELDQIIEERERVWRAHDDNRG